MNHQEHLEEDLDQGEQEEEELSEEEQIFKKILEANLQRLEFEKNGDYVEASELKNYLKGLGELYENKCIENLQRKHE
jgi:hypothetical protein